MAKADYASARWPFGMSRAVAADYVGFSAGHFDKMVADGRMPAPRRDGSRLVWLQDELQAALRALPREGDPKSRVRKVSGPAETRDKIGAIAAREVLRLWREDREEGARALASVKAAADAMLTVSAYTLRHTVATELRGRGVQPWELAGFLGHSTGYVTTEKYAKNRPEHLRGVVRAVSAYWSDLGALLGRQHLGPVVNQEQRSICVLPSQLPKGIKPLGYLVEPNGIEPLTSTMPSSRDGNDSKSLTSRKPAIRRRS